MADSSVDVTPGTGASIDTRTESTNGQHRQVMVIGDPTSNAGVAPVDATTGVRVNVGTDTVKTKLATDVADVTGIITTASSVVTLTNLIGVGSVTVTIYGTYAGVNVTFEAYDGVNWIAMPAQQFSSVTPAVVLSTGVLTTNSTNRWNVSPLLGCSQFRVRSTAWTSGTANVIIEPSAQFVQYVVNVATMPTTTVTGTVTANLGTGGTAATSLGKAEDAVHATGDTGVMALAVRNDNAATAATSANGDYSQISTDVNGTVFTRQSPSVNASLANVAAATASTTVLAANAARRTAILYNDSSSDCYLKYGSTASSTSFTVYCPALATITITGDEWAGIVSAIWNSATGNMRVTETTI